MFFEVSKALWQSIGVGIFETLYMTVVSCLLAYLFGTPLGVILNITSKEGIKPNKWVNSILGIIINIFRSVPFIILAIYILPFTKLVVGTKIGNTAMIVPLVVSAIPFVARMIESSLKEVDKGVIEASQAMGTSDFKIIWKVLLPEARPSILIGAAISITTILGYSTMAGFIGGGGLGKIAIDYGYYRYNDTVMLIAIAILIVIVQVFQEVGMLVSKKLDKRVRNN